jgi:hypothetical protein
MTTAASPWTISAAAERIELDKDGKGATTFTVTNNGPVDQRLVLDIVRSDNAGNIEVTVAEPQRLVPHGGSVTFLVTVAVPPGTPPAQVWVAGRIYPTDAAPEESSVLSDRVAFEIKPTKPVPKRNIWIWLIPAIVLVLVVLAVVLFFLLRDDPPPPGPAVHRSGELLVLDDGVFDLDELRASSRADADVQLFGAAIEPERFFSPSGNALMAQLQAPAADPKAACEAALQQNPLPGGRNLGDFDKGALFCFRTGVGRTAFAEVTDKVSDLESSVTLQVTTFQ